MSMDALILMTLEEAATAKGKSVENYAVTRKKWK
jgi:hypothetical protein